MSKGKNYSSVIYTATTEVRTAVVTALATTIVSFLPVFAMEAAEGKLFRPLAFTKSFALISSFVLGMVILPTLAYLIFSISFDKKKSQQNLEWSSDCSRSFFFNYLAYLACSGSDGHRYK